MERTMSVEEKIRRAEEIYERRRQGNSKPIATVSVREKKDVKLLKKMLIQILVCVSIYAIIYTVQHSNYIFSEDFMKKVNEILSYDTNFSEIYENIKNQVINILPKKEENNQEAIGGAQEITPEPEITEPQDQTSEAPQEVKEEQPLSQEEQDIKKIKETVNFIKPIEGVITSPYGRRENATGSVPKNHTGTDIAANLGTKIKAATEGEVVLASEEGDYGKHLKIQIGEVSIIYAHCNSLYVKQGDHITQGQEIAEVGSTREFNRTPFTF